VGTFAAQSTIDMKKLVLFALFLIVSVSACKKDDVDAAASTDWSTVVEGTYAVTQIMSGATVVNFPTSSTSNQVTFTRTATNQLALRIVISPTFDSTIPVYLTGSGTTVDIYTDTNHTAKLGTATKNSVNLTNGTTGTITAAR